MLWLRGFYEAARVTARRYRLTLHDLGEITGLCGIAVRCDQAVKQIDRREREATLLPIMDHAQRLRRHDALCGCGTSWYVDETGLKIRSRWTHLYRAIDRDGSLIDAMRNEHRDMNATKAFARRGGP